ELTAIEDRDRQVRSGNEVPARRLCNDVTKIATVRVRQRQCHERTLTMTVVAHSSGAARRLSTETAFQVVPRYRAQLILIGQMCRRSHQLDWTALREPSRGGRAHRRRTQLKQLRSRPSRAT